MGRTWTVCVHAFLVTAIIYSPNVAAQDNSVDLSARLYPEGDFIDTPLDKRLSRFVRIGRALSSFVRIGKSDPTQEYYDDELDDALGLNDGEPVDKRQSAFVRIGRGGVELDGYPEKRLSSFVRIGRGGETLPDDDEQLDFQTASKRGSAFIRMGKFPTSAYLRHRNGGMRRIDPNPYYRRNGRIGHSSFIRIGKRDTSAALRRMEEDMEPRYLRLGKELNSDEDAVAEQKPTGEDKKRMSNFVRIGRGDGENEGSLPDAYYLPADKAVPSRTTTGGFPNKRMSSFVRIGRMPPAPTDKRYSKFVRIGKSSEQLDDEFPAKRMSHFVRIGKSLGQLDNEFPANKRLSHFVRIGKSLEQLDDEFQANKRMSHFVRIGKNVQPIAVPPSGVTVVKDSTDTEEGDVDNGNDTKDQTEQKRISSFVRIGRNLAGGIGGEIAGEKLHPTKRALSSFVRIGKRNVNPITNAEGKTADQTSSNVVENAS